MRIRLLVVVVIVGISEVVTVSEKRRKLTAKSVKEVVPIHLGRMLSATNDDQREKIREIVTRSDTTLVIVIDASHHAKEVILSEIEKQEEVEAAKKNQNQNMTISLTLEIVKMIEEVPKITSMIYLENQENQDTVMTKVIDDSLMILMIIIDERKYIPKMKLIRTRP
jgi:hypothetical protein